MTVVTSVLMRDPAKAGQSRMVVLVGEDVFLPLLRFCRENLTSIAAERGYTYAISRLLSWLQVRGSEFGGDRRSEALIAFGKDLQWGTIRTDESGELCDETGLWWRSTSITNANLSINRITRFSAWCTEVYGSVPLNPERPLASTADQIRYWTAWWKRKHTSLLGHLKTQEDQGDRAKWAWAVKEVEKPLHGTKDPKAFPEDLIEPLLTRGFLVKPNSPYVHERYNLRDLAITLICLYGGCRISEPLHLFVTDIPSLPEDPGDEPLWISHPSEGVIRHRDERTGSVLRLRRADYLMRYCGKRPLTLESGRQHAGWKGALLHDYARKAFRVFWIDPNAAEMFYACWVGYLKVRPLVLRMPWAWLTKDGNPLGVLGFEEGFRAAMRRIGVEPNKMDGTTPHGLRHRYGRWFNDLDMDREFRDKAAQICLHHTSIFSQEVYRQVGPELVAEIIRTKQTRKHFPTIPIPTS